MSTGNSDMYRKYCMICHRLPFYMTDNSANKSCYLEKEYGVNKSLPLKYK